MSNEQFKTTSQSNILTAVLSIGMFVISTGSGVLIGYAKCKVDNKNNNVPNTVYPTTYGVITNKHFNNR